MTDHAHGHTIQFGSGSRLVLPGELFDVAADGVLHRRQYLAAVAVRHLESLAEV